MEKTLVSVDDLRVYRPLAKEINQQRVDPFIREAQMQDLRPILGDALYFDFMKNFDQSGNGNYNLYQELLNGREYTYNGVVYVFAGIRPMVCYFALARFAPNQPLNITSFGITTKTNEYSEKATDQAIKNLVAELRSVGVSYQEQTKLFLQRVNTYTLYNNGDVRQQQSMGVKFFDPDEDCDQSKYNQRSVWN